MKRLVFFLLIIIIIFLLAIWMFFFSNYVDRVEIRINRFEKSLFSITEENVESNMISWDTLFGTFPEVFATQVMQSDNLNNKQYAYELLSFVNHSDMREAYDSVALEFSDFSDLGDDLQKSFNNFSIDFPDYPLPQITTFFGGFNYGVVTYDSNIAIGLENFLGQNSKFYSLLGDPDYLRFQKQRKFILSNVMEVWFNEHFQNQLKGRDLLSQIIYKGKMMYFLDKILPNIKLEDKFRFTREQMNWVQESELAIWQYFVQQDLLFSTKEQDFRSFINYAPFAKGMPKEAPGRVGYYIGYQMVNSYMNHNDITLEELVFLSDSRDFLKQSKYKPTK